MKKIIFALLLLSTTLLPARAVHWSSVDGTTYIDKDSVQSYVDNQGRYDNNKKSFWIKVTAGETINKIEKVVGAKVSYVTIQRIIDYSNNTITQRSIAVYNKNGELIHKETRSDSQLTWETIATGSSNALWAVLVKEYKNFK